MSTNLDAQDDEIVPVSISDDGLTVRYVTRQVCEGFCGFRPAYFGEFELLPVAEVTRGPAEDQILRLYRAVFGRIPDAGGFEFWTDQYRKGRPLVEIAAEFAASDEGLSFWLGEYNTGMDLTEMARLFTGQDEYTDLYGESPTNAELVDAVYLNVLGRPGDSGGVAFWLGRLDDGLTVPELFVEFANSDENVEGTGTVR